MISRPGLIFSNRFSRICQTKPPLVRLSSVQLPTLEMPASKPKGYLTIFERSPKRLKRIQFLKDLFSSKGHEIRIAGGAVRDILRGTEPKDIDFATTALPAESLSLVSSYENIMRVIVTEAGQRHGTVAVKFKESDLDLKRVKLDPSEAGETAEAPRQPVYDEESPYEITTLRCDVLTDGRHAEVKFIEDWKLDAERRDLTINSMFLTLDEGELVDYYNGKPDLENGVIRFVGDAEKRIREDYLRILRFFRFWGRYGKQTPDEPTLETIKQNLGGLKSISGERIWTELVKILSRIPCHKVIKLMLECEVFAALGIGSETQARSPEYIQRVVDEARLVESSIEKYQDYVKQSQKEDKKIEKVLSAVLFSSLLESEEMTMKARDRLKFSNLERDSMLFIVMNRDRDYTLEELQRIVALTPKTDQTLVFNKLRIYLIYKNKLELFSGFSDWQVPDFPFDGGLMVREFKARGIAPGKIFKEMLEQLKVEWADSGFNLDSEALRERLVQKLDSRSSVGARNKAQ